MNDKKEKLFIRFSERVLKIKIDESISAKDLLLHRNSTWMFIGAIPIFIYNLVHLIVLLSTTDTLSTMNIILVLTFIFIMFGSLSALATPFIKDVRIKRAILLAYYIILVAAAGIIAISTLFEAIEVVQNPIQAVPTAILYLCLVSVLPLPHRNDSIALGVALIIPLILEIVLTRVAFMFYFPTIVASLVLITIYILNRKLNISAMETFVKSKELNNSLLTSSYYDALTTIFNRRALDTYWNYTCENEDIRYAGIIIFDIDDFKSYNDHYTHSHGDVVLTTIATKVNDFLIEQGSFLFRYGGEEFAVIVPNPSDSDIINLCHDIQRIVNDSKLERLDRGKEEIVTISLGAAIVKADAQITKDYIIKADTQLYLAKDNGKNCFYFKDKFYR